MVELSVMHSDLNCSREVILAIARTLKSHKISNHIHQQTLLDLLTEEHDPQSYIDYLEDKNVLSKRILLDSCCKSPILDGDYCIFCEHKQNIKKEPYYLINDLINFDEEWRTSIKDRINDIVEDHKDRLFISMIASQIKSLELNPIIPRSVELLEVSYQYVGKRILYYSYDVTMEAEKKYGRPDLDFRLPGDSFNHIGEYKVWSRRSKTESISDQCLSYFIPETLSGFVFVVNDSKSDIWEQYIATQVLGSKNIEKDDRNGMILDKKKNGINIYRSYHLCQKSSKYVFLYHFIYDTDGTFGNRPEKTKKVKATVKTAATKKVGQINKSDSKSKLSKK